ncbi:MAG: hypothetical protein J5649_03245 [Lachnospiraceae bacterium]|nr:hypothetical protein [Lachnospiraceae bacterium]
MFARISNGVIYNAYIDCNRYYIFSRKYNRKEPGFTEYKPGKYRKEINVCDKDLELFDIDWYVIYDVKIPGAPKEWRINKEDIDFENNKVTLWGYNYEGWKYRERGVSCKEFDYAQVEGQFIKKEIFASGGKRYSPPKSERTDVTKEEFMLTMKFFDWDNF